MMKNLKYASLAMAALAFAACSNDGIDLDNPQGTWNGNGDGYLAVNISMPTDGAFTRAANDVFDKGEASEYDVKDIAIVLFGGPKGGNEKDATFMQAINLVDKNFGDAANGNITLDKKYVARITAMKNDNNQIYALVVINRNKVFNITNGGSMTVNNRTVSANTKFSDIQNLIAETDIHASEFQTPAGGILMLNAPLWNKQGTTANPQDGLMHILTNVTESIYSSEDEANASTAVSASIYVERAVAKVTVQGSPLSGTKTGFDWELMNWDIDNTNASSFIVRNMEGTYCEFNGHKYEGFSSVADLQSASNACNIYRMVGGESTKHSQGYATPDADDYYRTYWCIDPNYNTDGNFNNNNSLSESFVADAVSHRYCAENTFDINHMQWGQTTRVLVKAKLTPKEGATFYAKVGDDKFYATEDVMHMAYNVAIAKYREYIEDMRNAGLIEGLADYEGSTKSITTGHDEVKIGIKADAIKVKDGLDDAAVAAANVKKHNSSEKLQTVADVQAELAAAPLNQTIKSSDMGLKYFVDGESFYQVRIKHFGDDLTPWNNGEFIAVEAPTPNTVNSIYPMNDRRVKNYLGRYGVVRNNWYHINVNGVAKIGHASVADLKIDGDITPDDVLNEEQWINVGVHVLSWAKRIQNNELGE